MGGARAEQEARRVGAQFIDVLLVAWGAMAATVDVILAVGAPHKAVLELRLVGLVVLGVARLLIAFAPMSARALLAVETLASGATCALSALIAVYSNFHAPYAMTPVLWWMALGAFASPRATQAVSIGAIGLFGYTVTASIANPDLWYQHTALSVVLGAVLVLSGRISERLWQLRSDLYESRRLGHYRLLSPIGHGGMNDVWLAWDETRRREVALKLLRTGGTAGATRRQFEREAELVKLVRSPHTVRILDYGASDDGFAYIALEYLRGMDLDELVHAFGPLELRRAFRLMRQAARGLGDAHIAGVIHRDIKPANVHCSDAHGAEDFVRILDFGVARTLDENTPADAPVVGTPAFMSPESFRGADRTPASDVYSLGATFYYAITGAAPIDADSPGEFQVAHERAPIVPPSLRASIDIPRPVEKIILKCLAKKAEDRYPDAGAVADALDAVTAQVESWTRDDAARWWHHARVGHTARAAAVTQEHTTDVGVGRATGRSSVMLRNARSRHHR
jgi:serine/threonine-protein kinase